MRKLLSILFFTIPCTTINWQCCKNKELRQLYLILIRRYNPNVQSREFLQDIILANHSFLIMMENVVEKPSDILQSHLHQ